MFLETLQIGIIFNAFVSSIIAGVSMAFIFFLAKIHKKFDESMQSYMWFWIITSFVWIFVFVRYVFIGFNVTDPQILWLFEVLIQTAVFFTGPPMFYYTALSALNSRKIAIILSIISTLLALISLAYVILPGGLTPIELTFFSAETQVNSISMGIFSTQVVLVFLLLLISIYREYGQYKTTEDVRSKYRILYAASILVYVILGSIDQSKLFIDWYIVVMRILYAGTFLFVYVTITQEVENKKVYFLTYSDQ